MFYIFVYCNPCNLRHHLTVVAICVNSDTAAEWLQSYSESCRQQRKRKMSKTQSQLSTHYIQIQHWLAAWNNDSILPVFTIESNFHYSFIRSCLWPWLFEISYLKAESETSAIWKLPGPVLCRNVKIIEICGAAAISRLQRALLSPNQTKTKTWSQSIVKYSVTSQIVHKLFVIVEILIVLQTYFFSGVKYWTQSTKGSREEQNKLGACLRWTLADPQPTIRPLPRPNTWIQSI